MEPGVSLRATGLNELCGTINICISFLGCCSKVLQTWWFKIIKAYSRIVLKTRDLKLKCQWGCALSEASRGENLFHAFLLASGATVTLDL